MEEANDKEIRYRDRETGEIKVERVFAGDALRFLYEARRGRLLTGLVLKRRAFNRAYGFLQRTDRSRRKIADFVAKLGIDASEAERPLEDYRSLDDFFTRRLKPGARPVDEAPEHFVSPADSRVLVYPRLEGQRLRVKASEVGLEDLLADGALATRFAGGAALVHRLAPADYHRFHFPEGGFAGPPQAAGRHLHSVHPIALAAGAPSFLNYRAISRLRTTRFGEVGIVEVGALLVGSIVETYRPGPVRRGAEKGYFRFGGSTVVMLVEPGRAAIDDDLVEASAAGMETFVKMGTRVARRV